MGDNADCNFDINHKIPYGERRLSVGNNNMQCHNTDFASAPYNEDGKKDCENKAPVVWHQTKTVACTFGRYDISFCFVSIIFIKSCWKILFIFEIRDSLFADKIRIIWHNWDDGDNMYKLRTEYIITGTKCIKIWL